MAQAQLAWDIRNFPKDPKKQWAIRLKDQTSRSSMSQVIDSMEPPKGYYRPSPGEKDYLQKAPLYAFRRVTEIEDPTSKDPVAFFNYVSSVERAEPLSDVYMARAANKARETSDAEYAMTLRICLDGWRRKRSRSDLWNTCDEIVNKILPWRPNRSISEAVAQEELGQTVVVLRTEGSSPNAATNIGFLLAEDHEGITICPAIHNSKQPMEVGTLRTIGRDKAGVVSSRVSELLKRRLTRQLLWACTLGSY